MCMYKCKENKKRRDLIQQKPHKETCLRFHKKFEKWRDMKRNPLKDEWTLVKGPKTKVYEIL